MSNGLILLLMTALFLLFGYMGVPVAFALMAGVLVACALTPISMQSMIGQMFHGIDSEILLAVPFFLLVGELMTSANVTNRMIQLAQAPSSAPAWDQESPLPSFCTIQQRPEADGSLPG